jgi:hypothetical protein
MKVRHVTCQEVYNIGPVPLKRSLIRAFQDTVYDVQYVFIHII